jgi:hypothetical protein
MTFWTPEQEERWALENRAHRYKSQIAKLDREIEVLEWERQAKEPEVPSQELHQLIEDLQALTKQVEELFARELQKHQAESVTAFAELGRAGGLVVEEGKLLGGRALADMDKELRLMELLRTFVTRSQQLAELPVLTRVALPSLLVYGTFDSVNKSIANLRTFAMNYKTALLHRPRTVTPGIRRVK